MAVLGYTTKQDLTSFGRILMMALVGIIIATVVNWFMHSETLDYIISYIGVAVFTGLTAYDVQKLKNIGAGNVYDAQTKSKLAILGALTLYLDFINLFLMLLRLFGDRRN
jgi:FtsH-binding integral membrane protein